MGEEAKPRQTVVDRDEDDALTGEGGAVVPRPRRGAVAEAATVNPEHHWQARTAANRSGRCPHSEEQAVFALRHVVGAVLHAVVPEILHVADTGPLCRRLRRAPAQVASWRCSVGNAAE